MGSIPTYSQKHLKKIKMAKNIYVSQNFNGLESERFRFNNVTQSEMITLQSVAQKGEVVYNTTDNQLYKHNGSSFDSIGGLALSTGIESKTLLNIEDQIKLQLQAQPSVFADGLAGTRVGSEKLMNFTNSTGGKINWYFFAPNGLTLNDLSNIYMVIDKKTARAPFIFVYTKPTGTGDLGVWYKSRITYELAPDSNKIGYAQYFVKTKSTTELDLTAIELTRNYGGQDIFNPTFETEEILYIGIGTDSTAIADTYNFDLQEVGYETSTGKRVSVEMASIEEIGNSKKTFITTGDIESGKGVYLNTDGTVSQADIGNVTNGVFGAFGSDFSSGISAIKDGNRFIVSYVDALTGSYVFTTATVNAGNITYSTPSVIKATNATDGKIVALPSGGFIAVVKNSGASNRIEVFHLIWNGLSYSMNATVLGYSPATNVGVFDFAIDENDRGYLNYSTLTASKEVSFSVVGGVLSSGTETTGSIYSKIFTIASGSGGKILHIYRDTITRYRVITTDLLNTMTSTSPVDLGVSPTNVFGSAKSGTIITTFYDGGNSYVKWFSLTSSDNISTTTIIGTVAELFIPILNDGTTGLAYYNNRTAKGFVRTDNGVSLTSSSATFGQRTSVNFAVSTGGFAFGNNYFIAYTGVVSGFATQSPDSATVSFVVKQDDVIGFAQSTVADTEIVEVALESQISSVHTGLIPGKLYYLNGGNITTSKTDYYAGQALSDTELLVRVEEASTEGSVPVKTGAVVDNTITDSQFITIAGKYIVPATGVLNEFVGKENQYAEWDGITFDGNGFATGFLFYAPVDNEQAQIVTGLNIGQIWKYTTVDGWALSTQTTGLPTFNYISTNAYKKDDIVVNNQALYQANNDIPEDTVFEIGTVGATWKQIGISGASEDYYVSATNTFTLNTTAQTLLSITVTSSGRYEIESILDFSLSYNQPIAYYIAKNGTSISQTKSGYQNTTASGAIAFTNGKAKAIVNLVAGDIITLRAYASFTSSTVGNREMFIKKIAGYLPVVGATKDFLHASRITTGQTGITANTVLLLNQKDNGSNIPYSTSTGIITLSAGKTYKLTAMLQHEGGVGTTYLNYGFYNNTTSSFFGSYGSSESMSSPSNWGQGGGASAVIIPTVTTQVVLKCIGVGGSTGTMRTGYSYLYVEEIGVTAATVAPSASGNILQTKVYKNSEVSGTTSGFFGTTQFNPTTTFTPKSTNSKIIITFDMDYSISAYGTDEWQIILREGSTNLYEKRQRFNGNVGGGSRGSILMPITGSFDNTSLTPKSFNVIITRIGGDDNCTVYNQRNVIITEIQN